MANGLPDPANCLMTRLIEIYGRYSTVFSRCRESLTSKTFCCRPRSSASNYATMSCLEP
jgi:hypothetical protein